MKTTNEHLTTAHENDKQWEKTLKFYQDEIILMRKKIAEVSSKNTSKEIKMLTSHFESQFTINDNVIDELMHEINLREDEIRNEIKTNPVAYDHRVIRYSKLDGKMEIFEKLFAEMKKSLNSFLSKVM